jgi:Cof subfamily protein (haloacid dehalogenase superfamily)
MIKLFATDIDGTLMPDTGTDINPACFRLIRELKDVGILFCVSSGRQYKSLRRLFAPVADDIAYVTQNGATVLYQDKVIFSSAMTKEDSEKLVRDTYAIPGAQVLYCTETVAYCGKNDWDCYNLMTKQFHFDMKMVDDPEKLPMPCVKYSLYLKEGVEEKTAKYFVPHWLKNHEVACGGKYFMDVMKRGTNKGMALKHLTDALEIGLDECAACGDNSNDLEMLQMVRYSVAVANARDEVKQVCRYQTASNNDGGVLRVMKKILE